MGQYTTTYDAGIGLKAAGTHDPADANAGTWDPATDPDTGHPTSADKPVEERVDWEVPVPPEDPAMEGPPADPLPEGTFVDPLGAPVYAPPVAEGSVA